LADVLTDSKTGTFDPADVRLFLGEDATVDAVMAALRAAVLSAQPQDVLLVYFAGHGLMSPWDDGGDPYLATADFNSEELRLHPHKGFRMRSLRQDVFEKFRGSSFLILDCCHAGGYSDQRSVATTSEGSNRLLSALANYELQLSKHTALLACPRDATTREPEALRHGVLTYYLLKALGGEAAGADGCVTFADATSFVKQQATGGPVGLFARDWGPTTVLTRPVLERDPTKVPDPRPAEANVVPLKNPLDASLGAVSELLDRFFLSGSDYRKTTPIEPIRHALGADAVAVVRLGVTHAEICQATGGPGLRDVARLAGRLGVRDEKDRRARLGYLLVEESGQQTLVIRLECDSQDRVSCLVVVNPERTAAELGEPLAVLLKALLTADQRSPEQAEVHVLTELRRTFGRVPLELYERCYTTYGKVLQSMMMVFEPVMTIDRDPRNIGIHSYEALARIDPRAVGAPGPMLEAAHTWGDRFIIERDGVLTAKAIHSYARAHDEGPRKDDPPRPLSVNVAFRALLSDAYTNAIKGAIEEAGIPPRAVTLEISERDRIVPAHDERWLPDDDTYFRSRLSDLTNRLGIAFAVDDFGVGHASLNRLSTLTLTHIKVDRAILRHPPGLALAELALVVRIANHAKRKGDAVVARDVVVEGVDDDARVSLAEMHGSGIHLVQGHVNEMPASAELRAPGRDLKERLAAKVRG
jgi:EAL domain-containing protein (putative c-di-GMP-specific phosphodiesterase class I)